VNASVDTWGIGGPQFLIFYAALCLLTAAWLGWEWRRVVGKRERSSDPLPDLGVYKLAMLSGGPQLAITTVAAKLGQDGYVESGEDPRTLIAQGHLPAGADALEREVFGTVHRSPGISTEEMRREVAGSEPIKHLQQELTQAGLLIEESAAKRLGRLWIAGAVLAAVGIARVVAGLSDGSEIGFLTVVVIAVVAATFKIARKRPFLTARGGSLLRAERGRRPELRDHSTATEFPYAVALWGSLALWGADPAFASTLGVPREEGDSSWSRSSCGAGGTCGAFGAGGHSGGGCGGGGCGGGGCGGG
jgi:uncharacterized protein (TIGR04222 family)